jgi:transcriptional regulator with XRE-family HTH domain
MASIAGIALKAERENAEVGQEALARAMGVSVKTVQRIEAAAAVTPRNADGYRAAIRRASESPDSVVSRGTIAVAEPTPSYAAIPRWAEVRIEDAIFDMARAGATNEQARYVREILRSDVVLRFVFRREDGGPRPTREQERHLDDVIEGMRFMVDRSAGIDEAEKHLAGDIQPPPTPGGVPIAPVTAAPEPGTQASVAKSRGRKR